MSAPLYLSRARLRSSRGESLSAIAPILLPDDPSRRAGRSHRLVWLLFQDVPDAARDFLWRDDGDGRYMILSHRPPQDPNGLFDLDTKPFEPRLAVGDELRFVLRASPTVARKAALTDAERGQGARGKRVDIVMDALKKLSKAERTARRDDLVASCGRKWLDDQGSRAGFTVRAAVIKSYDQLDVSDHERLGRRSRATVSVIDAEGVLAVDDPEKFLAKVAAGFGSAKAFGSGLMLIRRA